MNLAEVIAALVLLLSACGGPTHEEPPIVVEEALIDEATAVAVAAEAGLEPGLTPWEAALYVHATEGWVWSVTNTLRESSGGTDGTIVLIDANTGRVIRVSNWALIVEEEGVLLIKDTQEYQSLVEKYGAGGVSVKAVNLHEPSEAAFLREISLGFLSEPGCIIVLKAGDEGYVYQLDEEVNIVFRLTLSEFEAGARSVDALTMERFYGSLE